MAHVVFGDWPNMMRLIAVGERTPNSLQVSNGNVCADPGQHRTERIHSICGNRLNWRRLMISWSGYRHFPVPGAVHFRRLGQPVRTVHSRDKNYLA